MCVKACVCVLVEAETWKDLTKSSLELIALFSSVLNLLESARFSSSNSLKTIYLSTFGDHPHCITI